MKIHDIIYELGKEIMKKEKSGGGDARDNSFKLEEPQ